MEKYASISKITEKYLDGRLCKLTMEYDTPEQLMLSVLYEDQNDYWFDYQLQIDRTEEKVSFLRHHSEGILKSAELNRESRFEKAISNYFFPNKVVVAHR